MTLLARIRLLVVTVALLSIAVAAPASAQKLGPDGAPNPTASVVDQSTLLKQAPRVEGRIDIPDTKAAVLIQPMGRTWDYFHEVLLHWGGAIVILGTIVVLALAYLIVGRIRIAAGRSGQKILRFKAFERALLSASIRSCPGGILQASSRATAIAGSAVVALASCRIRIVRGHREPPRDCGTMAPDAGWLRPA